MSDIGQIKWANANDPTGLLPNAVFSEIGGNYSYMKVDSTGSLERAVREYSPVSALLMKMASMYSNGCLEVVNATTKKYTRGQYKRWDAIFDKPNPVQTGTEFRTQLNAFTMMRGYCYVMPIYASGFKDVPYEMWILPPWCIEVLPVADAPHKIKGGTGNREVFFVYNGYREKLDESKLILFKDTGSPWLNRLTWLPESRLTNLKYPISNGIGAMQSRHSLIHDRGAMGILSNDQGDQMGDIPMDEDEKEALQNYYNGHYGLTRDKKSPIIVTSAAMKWQSMSFNVKDLMLHEEHQACIKDICDAYGFPYRLLSTAEGSTYANQDADKKTAYQDCIIPMANSFTEQWIIGLNMKDENVLMLYTFEHLPIFQLNQKEKGEGLTAQMTGLQLMWNLNLITRNGMLLKLGEDVQTGELAAVYDKFKYQLTLEELGIIETDPTTANKDKPDNKK